MERGRHHVCPADPLVASSPGFYSTPSTAPSRTAYRFRASALVLACVVSRSRYRSEKWKLDASTSSLALTKAPPGPCACSASRSQRSPKHRQEVATSGELANLAR